MMVSSISKNILSLKYTELPKPIGDSADNSFDADLSNAAVAQSAPKAPSEPSSEHSQTPKSNQSTDMKENAGVNQSDNENQQSKSDKQIPIESGLNHSKAAQSSHEHKQDKAATKETKSDFNPKNIIDFAIRNDEAEFFKQHKIHQNLKPMADNISQKEYFAKIDQLLSKFGIDFSHDFNKALIEFKSLKQVSSGIESDAMNFQINPVPQNTIAAESIYGRQMIQSYLFEEISPAKIDQDNTIANNLIQSEKSSDFQISSRDYAAQGQSEKKSDGYDKSDNNTSDQSLNKENLEKDSSAKGFEVLKSKIQGNTFGDGLLNESKQIARQSAGESIPARQFANNALMYIRNLNNSGATQAKMTLSPPALGSLLIDVRLDNDKLSMVIKADTREALKIIESQIAGLKDKLAANGIRTEFIETGLNLGQRGDESQGYSGREREKDRELNNLIKEFIETFKENTSEFELADQIGNDKSKEIS